jgi:hypothetical protein
MLTMKNRILYGVMPCSLERTQFESKPCKKLVGVGSKLRN